MQTQDHSDIGPDVVRFLQLLRREIAGLLLVIWDGAMIHRCQAVKDYLAKGGAKRIHLERLPGYAPELNRAAKGSGICSSVSNSRMFVVLRSSTSRCRYVEPKNG